MLALLDVESLVELLTAPWLIKIYVTIFLLLLSRLFLTTLASIDALVSNMVNSYIEEQRMHLALQRKQRKLKLKGTHEAQAGVLGSEMHRRMQALLALRTEEEHAADEEIFNQRTVGVWYKRHLKSMADNLRPVRETPRKKKTVASPEEHTVGQDRLQAPVRRSVDVRRSTLRLVH